MKYLIIIFSILLVGCYNSNSSIQGEEFFDVEGFIDSEIERLSTHKFKLTKEIYFNQKGDSITIDSVDWDKELSMFRINLNKPAWINSAKLEKIETDSLVDLNYSFSSKKVPFEFIRLQFDEDSNLTLLQIHYKEDNILYNSGRRMKYFINGFVVEGYQNVKMMTPSSFSINGKIFP